jgi:hypothetical protein
MATRLEPFSGRALPIACGVRHVRVRVSRQSRGGLIQQTPSGGISFG